MSSIVPNVVLVPGTWDLGFWSTICKTVHPVLSDHCPVLFVLSVTLVHCGQTIEWIKMKLGMQVGLGPGHIVLDGDPAPLPQRGTAPQFLAHICCDQMAEWIKIPKCHSAWSLTSAQATLC